MPERSPSGECTDIFENKALYAGRNEKASLRSDGAENRCRGTTGALSESAVKNGREYSLPFVL